MSIMVCQNCTRHVDTDFETMEGELCLRCSPDESEGGGMTETKFTPGPWLRIHDHPNEDTRLAMASIRPESEADRESGDIATLFLCNYPERDVAEAQRANANLIAASPCMFKALSALLDLRENTSPFGGELQEDRIERAFDNARAALAKARGEQS